ncbi:pantoate--beta-alanine ligase [Pseudemcibacter aquimaris]|uniref:pantoate--beta-alanine ligase n=1 Tax=Pseudemcibacter aquimaris TaxID=2857064 RepID=UPI002011AE11|nr:pantoate--beta-alanine ligase [Pseudemcibacter aquimaris]MCC3862372.1 pantoate--beta-alanine ligase [Pseudemcibacter aquimaris]WDU59197.1 pantoate--beta-alanine ligase [Pseudemcibacter aquimaris]
MITVKNIAELNEILDEQRSNNKSIGFVPTMGALHQGHLSLIDIANQKSDFVVASIFVNPTQFAPNEDFDQYPRTEEQDAMLLEKVGADLLFLPTVNEIYAGGLHSDIKTGDAAMGLETDFRPDFFKGVVNVVDRLFSAVNPDVAVFGNKDYQQLQVIKQMVDETGRTTKIIGAPIIRDEHGLALSSRNAYLSQDEIKIAQSLNAILKEAALTDNFDQARDALRSKGFDKIDYIEKRWDRVLAAAWLGKTRLIDNVPAKN